MFFILYQIKQFIQFFASNKFFVNEERKKKYIINEDIYYRSNDVSKNIFRAQRNC